MNHHDQRVLDDWLKARDMLSKFFEGDAMLQGMLDGYMRDEVRECERHSFAIQLIGAAEDKHSPGGWVRTCIENGTLRQAIGATEAAQGRRERRKTVGLGRGRFECRQALRRCYEERNGPVKAGSKKLDDDDGMSWATLIEDDPELAKVIRRQMHRLQFQDGWTKDGYDFCPQNNVDYLREAAENVADGLHKQYEQMGQLRILHIENPIATYDEDESRVSVETIDI